MSKILSVLMVLIPCLLLNAEIGWNQGHGKLIPINAKQDSVKVSAKTLDDCIDCQILVPRLEDDLAVTTERAEKAESKNKWNWIINGLCYIGGIATVIFIKMVAK